jgi:hypothetical protein
MRGASSLQNVAPLCFYSFSPHSPPPGCESISLLILSMFLPNLTKIPPFSLPNFHPLQDSRPRTLAWSTPHRNFQTTLLSPSFSPTLSGPTQVNTRKPGWKIIVQTMAFDSQEFNPNPLHAYPNAVRCHPYTAQLTPRHTDVLDSFHILNRQQHFPIRSISAFRGRCHKAEHAACAATQDLLLLHQGRPFAPSSCPIASIGGLNGSQCPAARASCEEGSYRDSGNVCRGGLKHGRRGPFFDSWWEEGAEWSRQRRGGRWAEAACFEEACKRQECRQGNAGDCSVYEEAGKRQRRGGEELGACSHGVAAGEGIVGRC